MTMHEENTRIPIHNLGDFWQLLQVYNIYRLFLITTLLVLQIFDITVLGKFYQDLFLYTCSGYLITSLIFTIGSITRNPSYNTQIVLQIFMDILVITILVHCSGGMASGLAMLLVPIIAAASILAPGKISYLYTAMASIALLSEQVYTFLREVMFKSNFTIAGINGITLFAAAITINFLSKKLSTSQALSKDHIEQLTNLKNLSTLIIHKVQIGIAVVDEFNQLYLSNLSATELLNIRSSNIAVNVKEISGILFTKLMEWRNGKVNESVVESLFVDGPKVKMEFMPLAFSRRNKVLIFFYDTSEENRKIQENKLASVGRLTASIAHELRNPLGAISHAAQLLKESSISDKEEKLLSIITDNSERTNQIIENILFLSKSNTAPQLIDLNDWLAKFKQQFVMLGYENVNIKLKCKESGLHVIFNAVHLYQTLTNLCENGIRYSYQNIKSPEVSIIACREKNKVTVEVIDRGIGIKEENSKLLFEPFFTTEKQGTGLGLFIANELCQANSAKLSYNKLDKIGSKFTITFAPVKSK